MYFHFPRRSEIHQGTPSWGSGAPAARAPKDRAEDVAGNRHLGARVAVLVPGVDGVRHVRGVGRQPEKPGLLPGPPHVVDGEPAEDVRRVARDGPAGTAVDDHRLVVVPVAARGVLVPDRRVVPVAPVASVLPEVPLADDRGVVAGPAELGGPEAADRRVVAPAAHDFRDVQALDPVGEEPREEARAAGRAPGRAVHVREPHPLRRDPVDVRRPHPGPGAFVA